MRTESIQSLCIYQSYHPDNHTTAHSVLRILHRLINPLMSKHSRLLPCSAAHNSQYKPLLVQITKRNRCRTSITSVPSSLVMFSDVGKCKLHSRCNKLYVFMRWGVCEYASILIILVCEYAIGGYSATLVLTKRTGYVK